MEAAEPKLRYARPRAGLALSAGIVGLYCAVLLLATLAPAALPGPPDSASDAVARNHHLAWRQDSADTRLHRFVPRGAPVGDDATYNFLLQEESTNNIADHRRASALAVLLMGLLAGTAWCLHLHTIGGRLQRRRDQLALGIWLALAVMVCMAFTWYAPLSLGWLPSLAFIVPVARQAGTRAAIGFSLALGLACGALLQPFDLTLALACSGSGIAVAHALGPATHARRHRLRVASMTAGAIGAGVYLSSQLAVHWNLDHLDLTSLERGRLLGFAAAGLLWPAVGVAIEPGLARLLGNLSRTALLSLADLGNPLLQRIAKRAPGTWAHSRMMANLAESAAQRIGADALLVRVGAYYHDLGKADEPQFFIENNLRGQPNVHDNLDPYQSAQHIIEHVRASVQRGRAAGLPEDIIAFMHTHHGDGRPEYFYQKARRLADDPETVDPQAFRYPGDVPRDRENGILAIVDAVEAAARTLRAPERDDMEDLVQRIIMGKLRAGQLDDCGLSSADLRTIAEDLVASLMATAHDRIAYPWQKQPTGAWNAADQAPARESMEVLPLTDNTAAVPSLAANHPNEPAVTGQTPEDPPP